MKKLSIACLALTVSLPIFAYGYESSSSMTFISIVSIAAGVLQIILFFKIWGATTDIKKIKEHLAPKGLNMSDVRVLYYSGHREQAIDLLNKQLAKSVDDAFGNSFNVDDFKRKVAELVNTNKPYYEALGVEMPEAITSITSYKKYANFGKE